MRILLVDDDENLMESLAELLIQQRYAVDIAVNGSSAETYVDLFDYDLIVLDLMLPDGDGIQFARQFRDEGYANPLMILTAKESTAEKVKALDAGADDYVVKPFDFDELCARIRALLRREHQGLPPILSWGPLRLDPSACETTYKDSAVRLTPKEFSMMELFLRHPHRVYSLGAIIDDLWSFEDPPGEDAVRTHIKGLRRKLKKAGAPKDLIKTVYGLGYRLNESTAWPADSTVRADIDQLDKKLDNPLYEALPPEEHSRKEQLDKEHSAKEQLDKEQLDKRQHTSISLAKSSLRQISQAQAIDAHPSAGYSSVYFSSQTDSQLAMSAAVIDYQAQLRQQLADAGRRYLYSAGARIATLEKVVQALAQRSLRPALCQEGLVCAHQLSGSLGSFGFVAGSRTARQIEDALRSLLLQPQLNDSMELSTQLTQWVQTLRQSIEQAAAASATDVLLVITKDKQLSEQLVISATQHRFQPQVVATLDEAASVLQSTVCDSILLDVGAEIGAEIGPKIGPKIGPEIGKALATKLSTFVQTIYKDNVRSTAVPIAVIGTQFNWPARLWLSQQGVSIVGDRTTPPAQIMQTVASMTGVRKRQVRVAIALSDPHLLAKLNIQLTSQGFEVTSFKSTVALWQWFDSICEQPTVDILILEIGSQRSTRSTDSHLKDSHLKDNHLEDSDLEDISLENSLLKLSGLDLCRIIRADPRSQAIPIVFLTNQTESEEPVTGPAPKSETRPAAGETVANLYMQAYQAGGNDCIDTSVSLDELTLRLRNQLPRQNLTGLVGLD